MHTYLKFTVFLFAAVSFQAAAGPLSAGSEQLRGNRDYIVWVEDDTTLVVFETADRHIRRRNFGSHLSRLEICPSFPFVSFMGSQPAAPRGAETNVIYDLEFDKVYDQHLYLDTLEQRWSASGDYTYISNFTSFVLVRTSRLRDYLRSGLGANKFIQIEGHPLGLIWQIAWIGELLIYGSGVGEIECWGLFNTSSKKNYFLSCCGTPTSDKTIGPCDGDNNSVSSVVALMAAKSANDELVEISRDFSGSVEKLDH